jgi:hypothetical protein
MTDFALRSPLKIALCLTAAAFLMSPSSYASAQSQEPELSFYPAQAWNVATMKAPSGLPECAISSEYNNGFVVAFNGSDKWVQTLGVDFRQNIFTSGQNYPVKVTVPGQFNQDLQARASSGSALQVDIRKYTDFYKTAARAGVFDINVEGNSFRFYLTSFGGKQSSFEQCMAGQQAEVRSASADGGLSSSPDDMRVNEAMAYEQDETGKVAVTEVLPEEFESNDKPLSLTDRSAAPDESKMPALSKPKAEILEPADDMAMEDPGLMTPEPVVKRMKTPEIKVTREKMSATADFTDMGSDPVEMENRGEMARKIADLEEQVKKLRIDNEVMEEELTSSLKEGEQERLSISSENWNLERATMRYNEAERQVKRLGQQLQRERAECSLEKQELEAMLFDPQVTNQAQISKLADIERQLAAAEEEMEDQRLRYEERIKLLEAQLSTN